MTGVTTISIIFKTGKGNKEYNTSTPARKEYKGLAVTLS